MYTGIQYFEAALTGQEYEKLQRRGKQLLIRNSTLAVPLILLIGYGLIYFNDLYANQPTKATSYQIIGGIGGITEAILIWYYGSFVWNFNKDYNDKKKKIATGIIEGKRIVNSGKLNETFRMLFQKNEFVITKDTYDKIEKGAKIELHVSLKSEKVLFIKRIA